MRVQFALCAQTASVDRSSNRISIFNVIDHIPTTSLPILIPAVTFVAILENDRNEAVNFVGVFEGKINDKIIVRGEVPVAFVWSGRLARVLLTLNGIPIHEHGTLSFRLTIPGRVDAEAKLLVMNVAQEIPPVPRV
jgi:hypothetical protein